MVNLEVHLLPAENDRDGAHMLERLSVGYIMDPLASSQHERFRWAAPKL